MTSGVRKNGGRLPTIDNHKANEYLGADLEAMAHANNLSRWILDEFRPYLGQAVCEVGAGQGNLTSFFLHENINELTAFEPSPNLFAKLQHRFHSTIVNPVNARLADQSDEWRHKFDSIAYVNVLEHIEDHQQEVRQAYRCLKPGGHLLVYVPALSWLYSSFDKKVGHFRRYYRAQLSELVQAANFDIIKLDYMDMAGVIPWYLVFVVLQKEFSPGKVAYYDRLIIPIAKKLESLVSPPVGKNLLLVARKTSA